MASVAFSSAASEATSLAMPASMSHRSPRSNAPAALRVSRRGRLDPARHVGELHRDRLVLDDRPSHRVALLRVPQRRRQRRVGDADAPRGDVDATQLERTDGLVEPAALHPTEQMVLGHDDVVEHDLAGVDALVAELPELARHRVAQLLGHDEQRHAPVARFGAGIRLHEHGEAVPLVRVRDPHLRPAEHVDPVGPRRRRAHRLEIGAAVGFGQREPAAQLGGGELRAGSAHVGRRCRSGGRARRP